MDALQRVLNNNTINLTRSRVMCCTPAIYPFDNPIISHPPVPRGKCFINFSFFSFSFFSVKRFYSPEHNRWDSPDGKRGHCFRLTIPAILQRRAYIYACVSILANRHAINGSLLQERDPIHPPRIRELNRKICKQSDQ